MVRIWVTEGILMDVVKTCDDPKVDGVQLSREVADVVE
jgi:hypothetical protein